MTKYFLFSSIGLLENKQKNKVLDVLLKKHTHVDEESRPSMARQFSALGQNFSGSSTGKKEKKQKGSFTAQGIGKKYAEIKKVTSSL